MITKETFKNKLIIYRYRRAVNHAGIKYIVGSLALLALISIVMRLT